MRDERAAGIALIAGTTMGVVTMALHPSGTELLRDLESTAPRNLLAHGLAIAAVPLMLYGTGAAARRIREGAPALARLGTTVYWVASFAVLIAGIASGMIAPTVAERILSASAADAELWRIVFSYNGMINQAFALVYVVGLGAAVAMWSLAIWRTRTFARGVGVLGLLVGAGLIVAVVSGVTHLDVHTFGLIVAAQAIWMYAVGVSLVRGDGSEPEG